MPKGTTAVAYVRFLPTSGRTSWPRDPRTSSPPSTDIHSNCFLCALEPWLELLLASFEHSALSLLYPARMHRRRPRRSFSEPSDNLSNHCQIMSISGPRAATANPPSRIPYCNPLLRCSVLMLAINLRLCLYSRHLSGTLPDLSCAIVGFHHRRELTGVQCAVWQGGRSWLLLSVSRFSVRAQAHGHHCSVHRVDHPGLSMVLYPASVRL
ncbi:hypothetical protein, variant [Exophiala dermatitidis NIH/UT8656]|uniref:Uncharacterized protein n=1 Tax=Exophiala dermatitidis (strain ATCC 34100 / CBS 525.76 / NIH/UT8656) TaxID=858893 RepID=H6BT91_EXODN|nr:uncharacterized protein HMPREF1120_01678 [Exophiala dermatitidis NIH/UT8656]XP_009153948.1 hypothetical protein, variant [Exophiala dermatitidis NIH/UT8656]EHY53486.1 hypothetical protein, variant [Exophiala dermatitidis NIH/UT8656]EHY53487.1 hypothetical protein HMPREF1120_01678 [Exophiala dermatitidis NIH/UT8656]